MFDYKEASFYTDYFNRLSDFSVLEEFRVSDDKDEPNLFVGKIEVLNTIHPLIVRVEIPFTFPHNKLVFRTVSLKGYPHLIYNGKTEYGSWFCLNTPFAETAEEQLNQEVSRLKEWIARQMRDDLPPVINDIKVKRALAIANAYEWENLDEVKEFSSKAKFTFVGNFHNDSSYFKSQIGHIHCIGTNDERFYAIPNKTLANSKLPYILVDEEPSSVEFIKLKNQYNWVKDICDHLLPQFNFSEEWKYLSKLMGELKEWNEADAIKQVEEIENELNKETTYLDGKLHGIVNSKEITTKIKVPNPQKELILAEIYRIKKQIQKDHSYDFFGGKKVKDLVDNDYDYEYFYYKSYPFALGVKQEHGIKWFIFVAQRCSEKYETVAYDLKLCKIVLGKTISLKLNLFSPQIITEDMYFGRGSFSSNFKNKRIALIGLGAIGSMVASSLAHCGISQIGLWDNDIVEPGNICRSSYNITHLGEGKVLAIESIFKSINPFIKVDKIKSYGWWQIIDILPKFIGGSFYDNVNYKSQEDAIKEIEDYDLIIDCTGSNEMLHFLSYAVPQKDIISLCITNHANELLCITNRDGNPFELRKAYLSRIEQDTKNFYIEGTGCYSPTFLANNCDIISLANIAMRDLNKGLENNQLMHSTIYSYTDRGIVADKIRTYKLDKYDITLNISSETLFDAEEIIGTTNLNLGYIFGYYSKDGKQIMITHIVDTTNAHNLLTDAFKTSKGIIDYIGDYCYSGEHIDTYNQLTFQQIATKAEDLAINTNNPLLAIRNPNGELSFFLYINNKLEKFDKQN